MPGHPAVRTQLSIVACLVAATPTANNLSVMAEVGGSAESKQALAAMTFVQCARSVHSLLSQSASGDHQVPAPWKPHGHLSQFAEVRAGTAPRRCCSPHGSPPASGENKMEKMKQHA